ncbi:MAG TPA: S9 family peptidase [Candidatus Limiplasma sp.]|nr:S9 family peptidase [Candidatus Limiplasma sp.]HRX07854.1 S9 family peptidase [Candidatus Limiplasma sp.]
MHKHNAVTDDYTRLESLSGGEYHAAKHRFVYCRTCSGAPPEIRMTDTEGGNETVLVQGGVNPRLSPDGERICYLKGGQIWLYDIPSQNAQPLTSMRFGASDPLWSPSGKQICFISACADTADTDWLQTLPDPNIAQEEALQRKKRPVVIEDFGYKFDGLGFQQPEHAHLWVINVSGGKAWRITNGEFNHLHHNWSPDSETVIFISARCRDKKDALANDLFAVPARGGDIRRVTSEGWLASYPSPFRPMYTPDGKYIVAGMFDADMTNFEEYMPFVYLHRIAADGCEDIKIFPADAPCFECVQFPYNTGAPRIYDTAQISADGQYCLFCAGVNGAGNLYRASLFGEPKIEPVTSRQWVVAGLGKPQAGLAAVSVGTPSRSGDYWLMDEASGALIKQLTFSNSWQDEIALSKPEDLWLDCLDGNGRVHGWVLPPQNREPGKRYPAVLYIHGGPHPFYAYGFDYEHQTLAGAGFAVLYCNPRGSSSYGREHESMKKAYDGSAYIDLLQFVDTACRQFDYIDSSCIGAIGGSYGGFMVNYMAVHSRRFKALVTQRSIANEQISYASSDMQGDSSKYTHFEEFMVRNLEKSAVSYAENLSAPMLILHGMDDLRCPVEHAHQFYTALRDVHPEIPVKMILYPGCPHDQPRSIAHRIHYYNAILDWFTRYLKEEQCQ